MTSRFTELAIDSADPNGLARFWRSVLDRIPARRAQDGQTSPAGKITT